VAQLHPLCQAAKLSLVCSSWSVKQAFNSKSRIQISRSVECQYI
jgi:hypothetical protein